MKSILFIREELEDSFENIVVSLFLRIFTLQLHHLWITHRTRVISHGSFH